MSFLRCFLDFSESSENLNSLGNLITTWEVSQIPGQFSEFHGNFPRPVLKFFGPHGKFPEIAGKIFKFYEKLIGKYTVVPGNFPDFSSMFPELFWKFAEMPGTLTELKKNR